MTRLGPEGQTPPRLTVVEDPATPEREAPPSRQRGTLANWLLLAAMLLFAWLWMHQLEQTRSLAGNLARAEGEVAAARAEIVARDAHLHRVRDGIAALSGQVEALKSLAARAPQGTVAGEELGSAPSEGEPSRDENRLR